MNPTRRRIRRLLFVRPPAHLWPIINESDNFLLPLAFPAIAAYLRQQDPGLHLRIVDCLPEKIGYRSLRALIAEEKPDLVGVGEMIVYMKEGMKVLRLAKELFPQVVTVAGGHFHSHMPEYTLQTFPQVDYVVRYEGEHAFAALVRALNRGDDLSTVPSLAYRGPGEQVVCTAPAPLADLDALPMPAYDLMPMGKYAPFGKLWLRSATIQGSRGCPNFCEHCSWTAMEGEHRMAADGTVTLHPRRRQKSVARTLEEIDHLYHRYGVRYLFWVDGTWNADNAWLDELCTEIIRRRYKLGWWAFVRADLILEQERLGILAKMVRAGFRHTLFGGERATAEEMAEVGKKDLRWDDLMNACRLIRRKYPEVFLQATFMTGIRSETQRSMERLSAYARACRLDFPAYHPLQPWPGTPLYDKAVKAGWIEEDDWSNFDMFYPVMSSEHMTRGEIASMTSRITQDWVVLQPHRYLAGMLSPHTMRRRLHWWFLFSIGRVMFYDAYRSLKGEKQFEGFSGLNKMWKPRWYDS